MKIENQIDNAEKEAGENYEKGKSHDNDLAC